MVSRSLYPSTPSTPRINVVAPVNKGGTGGHDVVTAAQNLGAVSQSYLNQPNGVAASDSSGLATSNSLPAAAVVGPTLNGPTLLSPGQVASYEITNYDSATAYVVSASSGTIVASGNTVQFTAPATTGVVTLTINGKTFAVTVGSARPATPTITVKTTGSSTLANASFVGSVFTMVGGSGTHASSDWELYSDATLTNLTAQSQQDTVNKTSWNANGIALSTTYYGRVRYRDNNGNLSDWSSVLIFTTSASYLITGEEAILVASDKATSNRFGQRVAISSDGSRVVVGAYGCVISGATNAGAAYVFVRNGSTWTQEQKLTAVSPLANALFGFSVSMSQDGTRLAVGAYGDTGTIAGSGAVYVFSRNGTVWSLEKKVAGTGTQITSSDQFGYSVSISGDGTRLIAAAPGAANSATTISGCGEVFIFLRSGTNWTQEAQLWETSPSANGSFGYFVSMCLDGSRFIAGSVNHAATIFSRTGTSWTQEATVGTGNTIRAVGISNDGSRVIIGAQIASNGGFSTAGMAYVFLRTGTSWAQEASFGAGDPAAGASFGCSVSISGDGTRAVVGAYGLSGGGAGYVFSRVNSAWSQKSKFTASDGAGSNNYGLGSAISTDSTRIIIGAATASPGGTTNAGEAYILS